MYFQIFPKIPCGKWEKVNIFNSDNLLPDICIMSIQEAKSANTCILSICIGFSIAARISLATKHILFVFIVNSGAQLGYRGCKLRAEIKHIILLRPVNKMAQTVEL